MDSGGPLPGGAHVVSGTPDIAIKPTYKQLRKKNCRVCSKCQEGTKYQREKGGDPIREGGLESHI